MERYKNAVIGMCVGIMLNCSNLIHKMIEVMKFLLFWNKNWTDWSEWIDQ